MKTQLQEDFDESGSAPDGQPRRVARRPAAAAADADVRAEAGPGVPTRQAVWQRGRQAQEEAQRHDRLPEAVAAPVEPLRVKPHGFAPQPASLAGGDPDWLAAHLARDAALNERSEWSGRWSRRLAAWGAAGALLALVAGGGFWLYQQSQVDGALVVVANTNPALGGSATARTGFGRARPSVPAVSPVESSTPPPAPAAALAEAPPVAVEDRNTMGAGVVGRVEKTPAQPPIRPVVNNDTASTASAGGEQPETVPPPRRARSHTRKHPKAQTSAGIPATDSSSYRQHREETLMQCRAHGLDERQCLQRGCEMTRFGFACKG